MNATTALDHPDNFLRPAAPHRSGPATEELTARPAPLVDPEASYAPVIPMPPRRGSLLAAAPENPAAPEPAALSGRTGIAPVTPIEAGQRPRFRPEFGHDPHGGDGRPAVGPGPVGGGIAGARADERAREEAFLVRSMAAKIGQAAIEVLAGTRPIQQLARWLDPRSFDALMVRAALTRAAQEQAGRGNVRQLHRNPAVKSVHCCPVRPGVYESSLVVSEQLRQRALAMRLEQTHGVWKVTALEIG